MKKTSLLVCLMVPLSIYAEETVFSRTFGGPENDFAHSVIQTQDGGYVICGQTDSYGNGTNLNPDMWIIKLDKSGNKEWDKTYGGEKGDVAFSVQQTTDKGYIVAGTASSFGKGYPSIWMIKLDANGDSLWSRIYEGTVVSTAYSIGLTSDGGYVIAGKGTENILKLDKNGIKEWGKRYGWIFYSVEQTSDGGYIAAGDSVFKQLEWDYIPSLTLIKLNRNGDVEWSNPLGKGFLGSARDVSQTSDGGFVFSGDSIDLKTDYNHSHFALVARLDSSGKVIWKYFGSEYSNAQSIKQTSSENYITTGDVIDEENGLNILLVLLDKNGKEIWTRSYGNSAQWQYAFSVQPTSGGGYIVAGQNEAMGAGRYDWWILKLDESGNMLPTGIFTPEDNDIYGLTLSQNFPNPFHESTTIIFNLPKPGYVTLTVHDIYGRKREILCNGTFPAGEKKIIWTPNDLMSGTYFYRLQFDQCVKTRNLVVIK